MADPEALPDITSRALFDIATERARQDAKWGTQAHPDGTGPDAVLPGGYAEWVRDHARMSCQVQAGRDSVTWFDIALEEVTEAFAEEDAVKLLAEVTQCAAVFVAWLEAIKLRLEALGLETTHKGTTNGK